MVYGAINEKGEKWYTQMSKVFDAIKNKQTDCNWLITDADGYKGFWRNPVFMQHPLAAIEIVPWDRSLTLFFSNQKDLVEDFLDFFPFSEEFSGYNEKWALYQPSVPALAGSTDRKSFLLSAGLPVKFQVLESTTFR